MYAPTMHTIPSLLAILHRSDKNSATSTTSKILSLDDDSDNDNDDHDSNTSSNKKTNSTATTTNTTTTSKPASKLWSSFSRKEVGLNVK